MQRAPEQAVPAVAAARRPATSHLREAAAVAVRVEVVVVVQQMLCLGGVPRANLAPAVRRRRRWLAALVIVQLSLGPVGGVGSRVGRWARGRVPQRGRRAAAGGSGCPCSLSVASKNKLRALLLYNEKIYTCHESEHTVSRNASKPRNAIISTLWWMVCVVEWCGGDVMRTSLAAAHV